MFEFIESVFESFSFSSLPHIGLRDILDMVVVTFFIYKTCSLIQETRTWSLFKGVFFILILAFISGVFQLHSTWWILSNSLTIGIVALVVVFQPELRKALDQLGRSGKVVSSIFSPSSTSSAFIDMSSINKLAKACSEMGSACTGALIVIERSDSLQDVYVTGLDLSATISSQLLVNIFEKNTPLHDGAVLIRENEILAATCILPLSDSLTISKSLGTRHRAAIGISETSDCVVVVVSEETGTISVVENGVIQRGLTEFELANALQNFFIVNENQDHSALNGFFKRKV